jgi:hypothetical protein
VFYQDRARRIVPNSAWLFFKFFFWAISFQGRVNEYKHVVNSEGTREGAGVNHPPRTVPSAFEADVALQNRQTIEHLKEAVNERMQAQAVLFSSDERM